MEIKCKPEVILPSLYEFYNNEDNINIILPIISGNSNISIRVVDWFVTRYAKDFNVIYNLDDTSFFHIHNAYKNQLRGYRKSMFDPFCRRKRIPFYYSENKCIITTIGQLNFFKWAIQNKVIHYVNANLHKIINNMNENVKKTSSESSDRKKDKVSSIDIHKLQFNISLN
jgi:hypothetical protein